MPENPWIEMRNFIRAQLKLQAELSFERHQRFMIEPGLEHSDRVVDIGTGGGLFLGKVACRHPHIQFLGVEDEDHMIAEARLLPKILKRLRPTTRSG